MKNCALLRAQPLRILLFVLAVCSGLLALFILVVERDNVVGWLLAFLAALPLLLERLVRKSCELICVQNECKAGEHVIRTCYGKCHHWCETKEDADLIPLEVNPPPDETDSCEQCVYTHSAFGSGYGCNCVCHDQVKHEKKPIFRCSCHFWCWSKK